MLISILAAGAKTLSPAEQNALIAKINKAAAEMKSMSCGFTQTKYISLLSDKMVSEGKMYYRQPDKLRWEYTSPYQYQFVFNGKKVFMGNKTKKDVIDAQSNKIFREIARIMISTVTGKALSNTADFKIEVSDEKALWQVTLVPKKKELREMFSKIVLLFNKSNLMISEIDIYEKNNDRSNIKLKNISTNATINEALFNIPD